MGDLAGNAQRVRDLAKTAAATDVGVLAFPEMTLTGYPPEDLVLRGSFVRASEEALDSLAADLAADGSGQVAVVVGYLRAGPGLRPQNAIAVLQHGRVVGTGAKYHLPNYGVFDEARYFDRADQVTIMRVGGGAIALTICEDLWQVSGPVAAATEIGVGLVLCINGSPYERGKGEFRLGLCRSVAATVVAPVAYVNQVGGQDELVFDGGSLVVDVDGTLLGRAQQFAEELLVVDLDLPTGQDHEPHVDGVLPIDLLEVAAGPEPRAGVPRRIAEPLDDLAEVYQALVVGTCDYVEKNGFASVVVGLSGGIDSALTTTIAVDALGGDRVHTVAMPSAYSSAHSLEDAAELVRRQGTHHRVVPIAPMVDAYQAALHLTGLAEENLQARIRGTLLMALSNSEGHLVLTTGNKSELATGFSTLYGDSAGGFAPIKDIPKTLVWELSKWRNAQAGGAPIPENSISKAPSAELAPGQMDSDRLPSYDLLDELLDDYVENDQGRSELVAAGHDPDLVDRTVRLVDLAEYKRRQNPPGPKVTPKAFGRDRRLPITNRWREG